MAQLEDRIQAVEERIRFRQVGHIELEADRNSALAVRIVWLIQQMADTVAMAWMVGHIGLQEFQDDIIQWPEYISQSQKSIEI